MHEYKNAKKQRAVSLAHSMYSIFIFWKGYSVRFFSISACPEKKKKQEISPPPAHHTMTATMACVSGKMNPPKCIWEICIRLCSPLPYVPPVLISLWCGAARGRRIMGSGAEYSCRAALKWHSLFSYFVTRGSRSRLAVSGAADPFVRAHIWGRANARIKINWIHVVFRWRRCLVTGHSSHSSCHHWGAVHLLSSPLRTGHSTLWLFLFVTTL